jgi:hypothetical protein
VNKLTQEQRWSLSPQDISSTSPTAPEVVSLTPAAEEKEEPVVIIEAEESVDVVADVAAVIETPAEEVFEAFEAFINRAIQIFL